MAAPAVSQPAKPTPTEAVEARIAAIRARARYQERVMFWAMVACATLGLLLMLAAESHCGERRVNFATPALLYSSIGVADYGSTRWALGTSGVTEGNPLLRGSNRLLVGKALGTAALIGADLGLQKINHKAAVVFRFAAVAFGGYVTFRNLRNGSRGIR